MRKAEFQNYKKHILAYLAPADFIADVEGYVKRNNNAMGSVWHACRQMAQDGFFACYYSQVLDALAEIYGDGYKKDIYITKSGGLRHKSGEAYCWLVYCDKIATAGEKLYNELKKQK